VRNAIVQVHSMGSAIALAKTIATIIAIIENTRMIAIHMDVAIETFCLFVLFLRKAVMTDTTAPKSDASEATLIPPTAPQEREPTVHEPN
jgi:hypothetical protein